MDELAEQVVDALNELTGKHAGHRAAHAKGTLMAGTFTPSGAGLTTAAHMSGDPVPVTVRFSNGSGNPHAADYAQEGRGMAVKFYLPDGSRTDVVAIDQPCFFARTPEDFLEFARVRKPDPETGEPDMAKVGAYLGEHPEALPNIQHFLSTTPPESYVTCAYNSLHSFRWTDADGNSRYVRYRFEPEAGESRIDAEEAKGRGREYLQEDIVTRAGAAFRLLVVIAEEGDRGGRPDRGVAGGARARRGGPARADRAGDGAREGRRRARVRPGAGDRRDRDERRPDPALPLACLPDLRGPAGGGGAARRCLAPVTRRGLLGTAAATGAGAAALPAAAEAGRRRPRHARSVDVAVVGAGLAGLTPPGRCAGRATRWWCSRRATAWAGAPGPSSVQRRAGGRGRAVDRARSRSASRRWPPRSA